ncbi:MAG: hypothetical protein IPG49_00005 [Proteobacteria bacterium]|nr:hypothetical protein [Pseudomonadota bacterium]
MCLSEMTRFRDLAGAHLMQNELEDLQLRKLAMLTTRRLFSPECRRERDGALAVDQAAGDIGRNVGTQVEAARCMPEW